MNKTIITSLGEFVLAVVISIVVVALIQETLGLGTYEIIILALMVFIAWVVFRIYYATTKKNKIIDRLDEQIQRLPDVQNDILKLREVKRRIEQINTRTRDISDGLKIIATRYTDENNLFPAWYQDKLDNLFEHIRDTIETESFYFDSSLLQELDRIYNIAFQGRDSDYFYATTSCADIDWFISPTGNVFLHADDEKFRDEKIQSIRRIFTYESENELKRYRTKLCFFLHQQSEYDYRVISKSEFDATLINYNNNSPVSDFGIYGNHFVWETSPGNPMTFQFGFFCSNSKRIDFYKSMFDDLWKSARPYKITDSEFFTYYSGRRVCDIRHIMIARESSE